MKAVILARVSTKEQEETGHSLPAQLESLRNYAKKKGFEVVKEFCFSESAGPKIRKKFEQVTEYLRKHNKDTKILLCENVDRATRNFKDAVDLDDMRINQGLEIHFVKDGFFINNKATGNQMFMWEAKVFIAKQFLNRLSDDVKRSLMQKFENHEWPEKAPKGYVNVPDKDNKADIEPDEHDAPLIVKMFELRATGNYSYKQLRTEMFAYGLKNSKDKMLTVSMVAHILQNPFYYGLMRYNGLENTHKYKPLISKELFDKCQEVSASYNKKPFQYAAKPFIFRGLVKCAKCGCGISPESKTKKSGLTFIYYSCTNYRKNCERVYVPEKELLKPVYEALQSLQMPDERIKEITEGLRSLGKSEANFHKANMVNLRKEYDTIQDRISKMYDDKLDGRITDEMYDTKLREYKERESELLVDMRIYSEADEEFYTTANTALNVAKRALEIFQSSEVPEKRQFLNFLLQNCQLQGKTLTFEMKKPFDLIAVSAQQATSTKSKNTSSSTDVPTWLGRLDSNQRPSDYIYPKITFRDGLYHSHPFTKCEIFYFLTVVLERVG
jgi:site-specific DNA recombinase